MGDYTNNGIKLDTCGKAYYATKSMIEALPKDTANRDSYIKQAQEFEEIANRILKTYNGAI